MDTNQAIELLDQAVGQLQANREIHIQLSQAIKVIQVALAEKNEEKKPKTEATQAR